MISTVTFQRELGSPLRLKDVMFFLGLKKNLISVAFLRHIAIGQVKKIEVHVKNLYKIDVEDSGSLRMKTNKVQSHDVSELWHIRSFHFHHDTLNIMQ